MTSAEAIPETVPFDDGTLGALLRRPDDAAALLVLGHGAGAGMDHVHLERLTGCLAAHGIATLRYQFPYMERGLRRPDRPPVLERAVRAAVAHARARGADLPIFVGGRSMGARMSARAHAHGRLPVRGLVFFAFPLHRAVNLSAPDPTLERAEHLLRIADPMLFLAGSRDRLARPHLLHRVIDDIESERPGTARLHMVDTADHGFAPTRASGRTVEQVEDEIAAVCAAWIDHTLAEDR